MIIAGNTDHVDGRELAKAQGDLLSQIAENTPVYHLKQIEEKLDIIAGQQKAIITLLTNPAKGTTPEDKGRRVSV